jgi:transcriptional regulator with GAF, ATPase, and Fis domain
VNGESFLQTILRAGKPNLLLVGSDLAIDAAIHGLSTSLAVPLHSCVLPGPLALPKASNGVLLLRDVAALDGAQQRELLRWLDEHNRCTQVVSATTAQLLPLVERGAFDKGLYYRLNTVLEEVDV